MCNVSRELPPFVICAMSQQIFETLKLQDPKQARSRKVGKGSDTDSAPRCGLLLPLRACLVYSANSRACNDR